jgi:hypothetical protein
VSGFEPVAQDPDRARLRVRLDCRTCSDFNEVGRVYDGDEPGDLVIRGRHLRALLIGETKVTLVPTREPVEPEPEHPDLKLGPFTAATMRGITKRLVATVKADPFPLRSVSVHRAEVPGVLLEIYCLDHLMRRVWGERVAQAVAQGHVVGLPVRVFSVKLPRPTTV